MQAVLTGMSGSLPINNSHDHRAFVATEILLLELWKVKKFMNELCWVKFVLVSTCLALYRIPSSVPLGVQSSCLLRFFFKQTICYTCLALDDLGSFELLWSGVSVAGHSLGKALICFTELKWCYRIRRTIRVVKHLFQSTLSEEHTINLNHNCRLCPWIPGWGPACWPFASHFFHLNF